MRPVNLGITCNMIAAVRVADRARPSLCRDHYPILPPRSVDRKSKYWCTVALYVV